MHRFRRRSQLVVHRLNALSWLLTLLSAAATIGVLSTAFLSHDRVMALLGLSLASATLVLAVLQRIFAGSANCPLCRMPPLGSRACQKNAKARTLLGSYRLRVSVSTLLLNRFRCPYCGEPTRCSVKARPNEEDKDLDAKAVPDPFR